MRDWLRSRPTAWLPAAALIVSRLVSSMRDMPQMAFFLIYLQEQLGLPPVAISSIVSGAQVAGLVAALLAGWLTGKIGVKWVLVCGLLLSGVSSFVFYTHGLGWIVLLWFIGGGGAAWTTVGGSSALTRLTERQALGVLSAIYALSMTLGGAIGNPLAGVLIERQGFNAFGWAAMSLAVLAALVVVFGMTDLRKAEAVPAAPQVPVAPQPLHHSLLPLLRQAQVRLLIGLRGLPTLFYGMLSVLIPLLINDLSQSKVTVAAYGTVSLIVASAAQLLAGRAADRWGAFGPTLVAYSAVIISGCALFLGAGRLDVLFIFGILGNAAAWSLSTLMYIWVVDGVRREEHPAVFGLLHAVWSLCMIGGSLLGGWLVRLVPGLPFLILGSLNAGACFLAFFYYRDEKRPLGF